jgi:hypothetical protein
MQAVIESRPDVANDTVQPLYPSGWRVALGSPVEEVGR